MNQVEKLKAKLRLQTRRLENKLRHRQFSYVERLTRAKFDSADFINDVYASQQAFTRSDDEARVKEVITLTIEKIKYAMETFGIDREEYEATLQ